MRKRLCREIMIEEFGVPRAHSFLRKSVIGACLAAGLWVFGTAVGDAFAASTSENSSDTARERASSQHVVNRDTKGEEPGESLSTRHRATKETEPGEQTDQGSAGSEKPATASTSGAQGSTGDNSAEQAQQQPQSQDTSAQAQTSAGASSRDYALNVGLGPAPDIVNRETPKASLQGFFEMCDRGDFTTAAHYLHLWGMTRSVQQTRGPELAQKLVNALRQTITIDVDELPDTPTGTDNASDPPRTDIKIGAVRLADGSQSIRLSRVRDTFSNEMVWVFSSGTVRSIDAIDDAVGLPSFAERLPSWMRTKKYLGLLGYQWCGLVLLAVVSWVLGVVLRYPGIWVLRQLMRNIPIERSKEVAHLSRDLLHAIVMLVMLLIALPVLRLSLAASAQIQRLIIVGLSLVFMVAAMRALSMGVRALQRVQQSYGDPIRWRSAMTRLDAMRRVGQVIVVVVGMAIALMQYPTARAVGLSLLGSAGIAGAIIGFAAQKTFANLFAGFLISFTQPIRIGDTVVVEGEYGEIEEIASTHVVVKVWDLRRLVVPVTYFLDKSFENWTKVSPELTGTIMLYADYRVDVAKVREKLDSVLQDNPLFNGNSKQVIVFDMTDKALVLRVTVSANDAATLWKLRCQVREELVAFLQSDVAQLPRGRVENVMMG